MEPHPALTLRERNRTVALQSAAATAVVTSFNPLRHVTSVASQVGRMATGDLDRFYEPLRTTADDVEHGQEDLARKTLAFRVYTWLPMQIVAAIYLGLSFFERPAWCYHTACASPDGQAVPMSGMPLLPTFTSGCVDLACYAALLAELVVMRCYRGKADFWGNPWRKVRLLVVLVGAADCVFDMGAKHAFALSDGRTWRLAPILRPVICTIGSKSLRKRMLLTVEVLWDIKAMLCLITFFVLWFGAVMFAFFRNFCQPPECDESAYYGTLPRALLSTFAILTTANFPDVYMEAYGYHRVFALPFIAFASFGIFISLNLVFASVYSSHKHRMESRVNQDTAVQEDSLGRAFQLLLAGAQPMEPSASGSTAATTGSLPISVFKQFVRTLDWHGQQLDEDVIEHTVQMIDADGDEYINCDEFRQLCRLLSVAQDAALGNQATMQRLHQATASIGTTEPPVQNCSNANGVMDDSRNGSTSGAKVSSTLSRHRLRRTIRERDMQIERCMMVVIIINTCTIMYEVVYMDDIDSGWQKTAIPIVELAFTVIYVLEMLVKVSTLSLRTYWSTFRNKFDGVITIIAVAGEIMLHLPQGLVHDTVVGPGHGVTRFCTLLRALRVLRVLTNIREFSLIFQSLSELAPVFNRLGSVLLIVMLFFAQLGILMFGGQTYEGNPVLHNSSFDALHYYPNNFNDLGSAMVTNCAKSVCVLVEIPGMSALSGAFVT
eukprot:COSAG02_NODE_54_length_43941_cov_54.857990_55_plen_719_part_00